MKTKAALTEKQIAERKATLKKRRALATKLRVKRRRMQFDPKVRRWHLWNHDLDTLLHELVKNPELANVDPKVIVERAAAFADALRELQDRRRPATLSDEFDR